MRRMTPIFLKKNKSNDMLFDIVQFSVIVVVEKLWYKFFRSKHLFFTQKHLENIPHNLKNSFITLKKQKYNITNPKLKIISNSDMFFYKISR
jgi:hypothetical protein